MSDFDELMAVLALHDKGDDVFVGTHPSKNPPRTFGGLMMAQSFVAASRTRTRDLPPNALSAHFINGGDTGKDMDFQVFRLRDERRFANRRVDVTQDGVLLATMIRLLSRRRPRSRAQRRAARRRRSGDPAVDQGAADGLRGEGSALRQCVAAHRMALHNDPSWVMRDKGNQLDHNRVWVRADGVLPDDPVLHTATMLYCSDTTVLDSIITTHGLSWGFDRIFAATVNHSVWFHRQVDFNDWVLYSTSSPVATDSRGLGTGHFFDRSRHPVASVVQEGLVKYFPDSH